MLGKDYQPQLHLNTLPRALLPVQPSCMPVVFGTEPCVPMRFLVLLMRKLAAW